MTTRIDVLPVKDSDEKGFVRLVSFTQPAAPTDFWSGDLEAVRNARVSYDGDWRTGEDEGKDEKLLRYMLKNRHTSPFEAINFTFEVKAPFFVLRQWHRHRTWSYNELSGRYAILKEGYYVPEPGTYGVQSKHNKQVRDIAPAALGVDAETAAREMRWEQEQRLCIDNCYLTYHKHVEEGMAREVARIVIPLAAYTRMFASVDLHNLLHFIDLRMHDHAQYEIQLYAKALLQLIEPIVPVSVKAFKEYILNTDSGVSNG